MKRILRLTIEENVFNYQEVVDEVNTIIIAVSNPVPSLFFCLYSLHLDL